MGVPSLHHSNIAPFHSSPHLPGSVAAGPQLSQQLLFAIGIHALPETTVNVGSDLAFSGEPIGRLLFEHTLIIGQIIADAFVHHEETTVDEARLTFRFFLESGDGMAAEL